MLFGLMVGMGLLYRGNLSYGSKDSYLPKTVYAQEIQPEVEVLPLILYNQKREKIIVRDGTFYETAADFHMALPLSVLEGEQGVEVTVVCKDLESGKCMQKEVLLKAK